MADVGNIQSIVLKSSTRPFAAIVLAGLGGDREGARAFLKAWSGKIGFGPEMDPDPRGSWNIAISWPAMERVLAGREVYDPAKGRKEFAWSFTGEDQQPDQPAVREHLGFIGTSDPAHWWGGAFTSRQVDIALIGHFDTDTERVAGLVELRSALARHGLDERRVPGFADGALSGRMPEGGRVHFGYVDGISGMDVDWADTGPAAQQVNCREFVIGYPTDDYPTVPRLPGPWRSMARDSSYVGITWIYQDVARFNGFLKTTARAMFPELSDADGQERVAAKIMGRWRDGSPLSLYPETRPDAPQRVNQFGFADDPKGLRCPLASHIRVAHTRDQPLTFANQSRFPAGPPRLLRRGFSYGPPLTSDVDDGQDRGLVGMFFFARPNEQFYSILRWMQKTEFSENFEHLPGGFAAQDYLCGNRSARGANTAFQPDGHGSAADVTLSDFIRYKGVVTLLVPSRTALDVLAAG